ncbi:hypothetical protein QF037_009091 [Streptomyces canus]|nr:hypothetical protein [Streptomyces canus]
MAAAACAGARVIPSCEASRGIVLMAVGAGGSSPRWAGVGGTRWRTAEWCSRTGRVAPLRAEVTIAGWLTRPQRVLLAGVSTPIRRRSDCIGQLACGVTNPAPLHHSAGHHPARGRGDVAAFGGTVLAAGGLLRVLRTGKDRLTSPGHGPSPASDVRLPRRAGPMLKHHPRAIAEKVIPQTRIRQRSARSVAGRVPVRVCGTSFRRGTEASPLRRSRPYGAEMGDWPASIEVPDVVGMAGGVPPSGVAMPAVGLGSGSRWL